MDYLTHPTDQEIKEKSRQFFNNTEIILYSVENPSFIYIVKGYNYPTEKYYIHKGQFYHYEFCGNGNYAIRESAKIRTPRFKKDEYCKTISIAFKI